jgi:hypothetical protein
MLDERRAEEGSEESIRSSETTHIKPMLTVRNDRLVRNNLSVHYQDECAFLYVPYSELLPSQLYFYFLPFLALCT